MQYFTCLRPNAEKYINFSVPLEKEVGRIDKKGIQISDYKSQLLQITIY